MNRLGMLYGKFVLANRLKHYLHTHNTFDNNLLNPNKISIITV